MASSPVIEWRSATSPYGVLSSLAFSGTGYAGAIGIGTASISQTVRVYNNFAGATGIADATNCVIALYDDTIHQGIATGNPSVNKYVNVKVADYNGNTLGADIFSYSIGGTAKHAIPTNGGTISGATANYITVTLQVIVPANASQGAVSQGIWIEYNTSA
jgi:hypothetical protein